jgi:aminopeptidase N
LQAGKTTADPGEAGEWSPNTTVVEEARMAQYDVKYHHLDLNLTNANLSISGNVLTRALVTETTGLDTFTFELHPDYDIDSVKFQGQIVPLNRVGGVVNALLPSSVALGAVFDIQIWYNGIAPTTTASPFGGGGFSRETSPSWGATVVWSLSQPYAAYEWWPCKQHLSDKIDSLRVWISTPNTLKGGSQGVLTGTTTLPGNRTRHEWFSTYPICYYLVSVAVGPYVDYSLYAYPQGSDSVLIQNYVYNNPQTLPFWVDEINATAAMMEAFAEHFGPYPFAAEKYGHCMAPLGGGMEHQTMTTQGTFGFTLTAHELFHQWFGDYTTCRTWNDLAVNEGFASYGEFLAYEALNPTEALPYMQEYHNDILSENDGSVFVPTPENVNRLFDYRLTYLKGAAVLHTLRHECATDSLFYAACRHFLNTNAFANADAVDLKTSFETVTGEDFDWFFDQWWYGEGHPTYSASWNQVGDDFVILLTHTASAPSITPLFQAMVDVRLTRTGAPDTTLQLWNSTDLESWTVTLNGQVTGVQLDYRNWILNEVGSVQQDANLQPDLSNQVELAEGLQVVLAPNPTSGYTRLLLEGNTGVFTFKVVNVSGQLVHQQEVIGESVILYTHEWPAGVYVVQLQTSTGETAALRLVVQ